MFVGYLGTYIGLWEEGIVQRHLCSWFDEHRAEPLTEELLASWGYERSETDSGRCVFHHKEKGYLSLACDMSIQHTDSIDKTEIFQEIDPAILPSPVEKRPLHEGIEKNIHQTGGKNAEGNYEYPEIFKENRKELIDLNPDYKFYYWTDAGEYNIREFILEYYGQRILDFYNSISPYYGAAKADFFRYLCIYVFGGVYLDLKSTIAAPLDRIIRPTDRFIVSFWWHGRRQHDEVQHMPCGEYEQYYIICASGHPVFWRLIHQVMCLMTIYRPEVQGVGAIGTFIVTGPIVYSRMIEAYGNEAPIRHIHSLSNGIEYSILTHQGGHHSHTGRTHYTHCNFPLIFSPDLKEKLQSEFSSKEPLWLLDGWGGVVTYDDYRRELRRERLVPCDYSDFFLMSSWPVSTPSFVVLRRSGYIPRSLPQADFQDAGTCMVALEKRDESNRFFSINPYFRETNWDAENIGGQERFIPVTRSMMDGLSVLMDSTLANFVVNGSSVGEPLFWPDPAEEDAHYFRLGEYRFSIAEHLEVLSEIGKLPKSAGMFFSLRTRENEAVELTVMRTDSALRS